ncbi:MAG: hypothetical protein OEW90_19570, partial [Betaproteobacteria bacterium]|nr:hypothetical protein [Betaproteobacteria bacterium]
MAERRRIAPVSARRRFLLGAAALLLVREALAAGTLEKGVYRVRGEAHINDAPAKRGMDVKRGDIVATATGAEIIFVVNRDAFLLRGDSRLEVGRAAADVFRLITGALLSVYQPGVRKTLHAQTATIGIRGTGIYVESAADRTYVCTCYGEADLIPLADPGARETVRTRHHEQPRYILGKGAPQMMMKAPVVNHTDAELAMIESLVGR